MMTDDTNSQPAYSHQKPALSTNTASTGRRMKRNVRIGGRRTTIVLEAYVWDCIDALMDQEELSLDVFCEKVNQLRRNSSMASSARLVVLTYFRLLGQINSPPFVDPDIGSPAAGQIFSTPEPSPAPVPLLDLALRRFAQDEARVQ